MSMLAELIAFAPSMLIDRLLETIQRSFGFARLEFPASRTFRSVISAACMTQHSVHFAPYLHKYAEDVNFLQISHSGRIFHLFTACARLWPIDESMLDIFVTLMRNCLAFVEHSSLAGQRHFRRVLVRAAATPVIEALFALVVSSIEEIDVRVVCVFIEPFHRFALAEFESRAIHAESERDFGILRGLIRGRCGIVLTQSEAIEAVIVRAVQSGKLPWLCLRFVVSNKLSWLCWRLSLFFRIELDLCGLKMEKSNGTARLLKRLQSPTDFVITFSPLLMNLEMIRFVN
jgi:hypothetical protein